MSLSVWFVRSSVVHMGDEYVNNGFPFIDTQSGGSLQGFLDNSAHMLELLPDDVRLIPGHGTVSSKAEFATWAADVKESVSLVQASMKAGKDLPTIIAEGLPDKFDSWGQGFIKEDAWITTIYNSGAAQQ
jgi:glyoxylase-like metal-dependent hydrolase (beta-lactamase superfamily II)